MSFVVMGDELVPEEQATINVRAHGFNYGASVFEGIRGYWSADDDELYIFRLADHITRLMNSAKLLHFGNRWTHERIVELILELVRRNEYREDIYIRPVLYKGVPAKLGIDLRDAPDELVIYSFPQGEYLSRDRALSVVTSPWMRIPDNAIPARGKIGGTYINPALAKTDALIQGADECIMLNSSGSISEGTTSNLFLVINGELVTPSTTDDILVGITRDSVMEIASTVLGIPSVQRTVDRSEIYSADEAFLCGTGAEIAAIGSVDGRTIGAGAVGEVTRAIQDAYRATVATSKDSAFSSWRYSARK